MIFVISIQYSHFTTQDFVDSWVDQRVIRYRSPFVRERCSFLIHYKFKIQARKLSFLACYSTIEDP